MPETIEITGIFGKKQRLTEDEFIGRWRAHASEFYKLASLPEDYEQCRRIDSKVTAMARREFYRILNTKHPAEGQEGYDPDA